jgi:hypothetical protein
MKSILDPTFVYVPAHKTDITGTFKKYGFAAPQAKGNTQPDHGAEVSGSSAVAAPIPLRRKHGMG